MKFDPEKLETTFIPPATPSHPINGRKYTLTHSDTTGIMFLDIGTEYNYPAIDEKMRDELIGVWKLFGYNFYNLFFYAYVEDSDFKVAAQKYAAFKYHMNLALQAVVYGDGYLFETYPELINTPIYVKFDSNFPVFNNYENYGYVRDYML